MHDIVTEEFYDRYLKQHGQEIPQGTMSVMRNIFYIICLLFGAFGIIGDILRLLISPKSSLWVKRFKRK